MKVLSDLRSRSLDLKNLDQYQIEIENEIQRKNSKNSTRTPLHMPLILYSQNMVDVLSKKKSI